MAYSAVFAPLAGAQVPQKQGHWLNNGHSIMLRQMQFPRRQNVQACVVFPESRNPQHVSVRCSKRKLKARSTIRADVSVGAAGPDPARTTLPQLVDACWRFLRPHTIRGTFLGSIALVCRVLIENSHLINWQLLPKAFCGIVALMCGNGYIVGINQIFDIGIDKVNKPFLPIAAGDLSVPEAWLLVLLFAAVGVAIVIINFGPFISALYSLGLLLGTIYSVPPFRMKRFPVAAFLIIATVRGFLLNFGVYYAIRAALEIPFQWSPPVAFITTFVTVFALVIAITKDLPDVEGDRKFQISTLATNLGVRNIAFLGAGLLLSNYAGATCAAIYMPRVFNRNLMIISHCILALCLMFQTWLLDRSQYKKVVYAFSLKEFYESKSFVEKALHLSLRMIEECSNTSGVGGECNVSSPSLDTMGLLKGKVVFGGGESFL